MIAILALVGGFCFGIYATGRVLDALHTKWGLERAQHEAEFCRAMALKERKQAFLEQRAAKPSVIPPMPPDLLERCQAWDEEWANEDERRTILALFQEHGDWERVRQNLLPLNAHRVVQ